jgi:type 1 glutamine amidotransferase
MSLGRWLLLAVALMALARPSLADTKRLLLIGQGPDGHPQSTHEYMAGVELLTKLLEPSGDLSPRTVKADGPWADGPELLDNTDGVVLFVSEGARWTQADEKRRQAFDRLTARGGGLVVLHWGMGTKAAEPIEPFLKLFGGCHGGPDRKYQVLEAELHIVDPAHPVVAGLTDFRARDEFYYQLKFVPAPGGAHPLVQATIDGRNETVAWSWERPDGGRSFGFTGLHFHDNWKLPQYRQLVTQAVRWTLKLPKM